METKNLAKNEKLMQFFKFAIVGGVSTIVDWAVFFLLSRFLITGLLSGQALKQVAKGLSFVVSAAFNFVFNRQWTFHSRDKHIATQTLKFYTIATAGLIFNNIIFYLVTKIIGWIDFWGLFFATGIVFFWNFFMNRAWTFKK